MNCRGQRRNLTLPDPEEIEVDIRCAGRRGVNGVSNHAEK